MMILMIVTTLLFSSVDGVVYVLQPTAEQLRIAQLTSSDVEPEVTKKINQARDVISLSTLLRCCC